MWQGRLRESRWFGQFHSLVRLYPSRPSCQLISRRESRAIRRKDSVSRIADKIAKKAGAKTAVKTVRDAEPGKVRAGAVRQRPRLAAVVWRALGDAGPAAGPPRVEAARRHPDHVAVLRRGGAPRGQATFSRRNGNNSGNTARVDGENAAPGGAANSFQKMS